MPTVNVHQAKTQLSKLVEAVETGAEAEVIIARNGRPAARLVPIQPGGHGQRIGVARGAFVVPETIDAENATLEKHFSGSCS
jgi:prevent-host-death family protein